MHRLFAELEPSVTVTEQNLADRVRYIVRSNTFDVTELERLRREAVPSSGENAAAEDAAPQMPDITQKLTERIDDLKQRIAAWGKRIRRYTERSTRFNQNRLFQSDQKRLYESLERPMVSGTGPAPNQADTVAFWRGLWSEPVNHSEGPWTEVVARHSMEEIISTEDVKNLQSGQQSKKIHERVLHQLKRIIARHHFLASISTSLDNVLGDAMLLIYSFSAVFICLTAYTFTVVDNFYQSVRYFFFFVSLLVESLNQCVIGQILSDHSEKLTESIYSADWSYASPEAKKIMLIFMMRAQKPFQLTAKGFRTMNLNTFSTICSTSYQFFNLLHTVYS
ncbi:unnamed protein product [Parnassius apollo]|uniref:(apollo) hypothetical protein n=1 Tax=Parnassius apollo TaxID=110799 RepID=A0A8S3WPW2_PARAO|nr:unnamed protein product [Parnassius apollo]